MVGQEEYVSLEHTDGRSAFWRGWIENVSGGWHFCALWGRIGSKGQTKMRRFFNRDAALAALQVKTSEKLNKGYAWVEGWHPKPMATLHPSHMPVAAHIRAQIAQDLKPKLAPRVDASPPPKAASDDFDWLDALQAR